MTPSQSERILGGSYGQGDSQYGPKLVPDPEKSERGPDYRWRGEIDEVVTCT